LASDVGHVEALLLKTVDGLSHPIETSVGAHRWLVVAERSVMEMLRRATDYSGVDAGVAEDVDDVNQ
jgi:hypothetical protein